MAKRKAERMWKPAVQAYGSEEKDQLNLRAPKELLEWLEKEKKALNAPISSIVFDALRLRRDLGVGLMPLQKKVLRYALDEDLDFATQKAEVLRRLIERGLQDIERTARR